MIIKNVIDTLPRHPTRKWTTRFLDTIDTIVVHQSATAYNASTKGIAKYHITPTGDRDGDGIIEPWERNHLSENGAPAIAYHYTIEKDGVIYHCNSWNDTTWHAGMASVNKRSLSICVIGNFSGPSWDGTDEPTDEQLESLLFLVENLRLMSILIIPKENIRGHCDIKISKENCPGTIIMNTINALKT